MAKFDYIKWVTENKYGNPLNEQTENSQSYQGGNCDGNIVVPYSNIEGLGGMQVVEYFVNNFGSNTNFSNVSFGPNNAGNYVYPNITVQLNIDDGSNYPAAGNVNSTETVNISNWQDLANMYAFYGANYTTNVMGMFNEFLQLNPLSNQSTNISFINCEGGQISGSQDGPTQEELCTQYNAMDQVSQGYVQNMCSESIEIATNMMGGDYAGMCYCLDNPFSGGMGGDTGSFDTGSQITGSNPFCCDINAMNFGQTAAGIPAFMGSLGAPEEYVMQNGPNGPLCDNSICQGNVNEPTVGLEPGGDQQQIPTTGLGMGMKPTDTKMKPKPGKSAVIPRPNLKQVKRNIREAINKLNSKK